MASRAPLLEPVAQPQTASRVERLQYVPSRLVLRLAVCRAVAVAVTQLRPIALERGRLAQRPVALAEQKPIPLERGGLAFEPGQVAKPEPSPLERRRLAQRWAGGFAQSPPGSAQPRQPCQTQSWNDTPAGKAHKCRQQEDHRREVLTRAIERHEKIAGERAVLTTSLAAAAADIAVREAAVAEAVGATAAAEFIGAEAAGQEEEEQEGGLLFHECHAGAQGVMRDLLVKHRNSDAFDLPAVKDAFC